MKHQLHLRSNASWRRNLTISCSTLLLLTSSVFGVFQVPETAEDRQWRRDVQSLMLEVQVLRGVTAEKLLTPSQTLTRAHSGFLAGEGERGITRILDGQSIPQGVLPTRGDGAYFSFATRSHSYNFEPDISFRGRTLSAGFYGLQKGYILALGRRGVTNVIGGAESPPKGLTDEEVADWRFMWSELGDARDSDESPFADSIRRVQRHLRNVGIGDTYILRLRSPGEHDHLVAFEIVALDAGGITILWRVLHTWPIERDRGRRRREEINLDNFPSNQLEALRALSAEELVERVHKVNDATKALAFSVPEEVSKAYFDRLGTVSDEPFRYGVTRLLKRYEFPGIWSPSGAGAYYSFSEKSHDYDDDPDIEFDQIWFSSGFSGGDKGYFVDLGVLSDEQLRRAVRGEDPGGSEEITARWKALRAVESNVDNRRAHLRPEDERRLQELEITDRARVWAGHSYLLRTARYGDKDHESIVTVLDYNNDNVVIGWELIALHRTNNR